MTVFLTDSSLVREIRSILSERESRSAVAFWGRGSEDWVTGDGAKVVANLSMGGTNPYALRKVRAEIRQCDTLHAKVYIGAKRAVVSSSNASINGLALEGSEQAGWIEAGVLLEQVGEIGEWFDELWCSTRSSTITSEQWRKAETQWRLRSASYKPSLANFTNFDTTAPELPFVTWFGEGVNWTMNGSAVEKAIGTEGDTAERRVLDGVWITHESDGRVLANRWVLFWRKLSSNGLGRAGPWFVQVSDVVVKGGFRWGSNGKPQDVLLASEDRYPPPFDPREPDFRLALAEVLANPEFARLLDDDVEGAAWYGSREDINRKFWATMKKTYRPTR